MHQAQDVGVRPGETKPIALRALSAQTAQPPNRSLPGKPAAFIGGRVSRRGCYLNQCLFPRKNSKNVKMLKILVCVELEGCELTGPVWATAPLRATGLLNY